MLVGLLAVAAALARRLGRVSAARAVLAAVGRLVVRLCQLLAEENEVTDARGLGAVPAREHKRDVAAAEAVATTAPCFVGRKNY